MQHTTINTINQFLCKGCLLTLFALGLTGREINVPRESTSIQAAIDSAKPGDTVIVQHGIFRERLIMKTGITVRSDGNNAMGQLGLARAEATILNHPKGMGPGVTMAKGSTLDGFTITRVGKYDEALWQKHYNGSEGKKGIPSYHC
jgi:hypothetical protein